MSLTIKPGARLYGAACTSEFIVVKSSAPTVELTIGGHVALLSADGRDAALVVAEGHGEGAAMGKRYVDQAGSLELLCTKAGAGVPALDGELLVIKDAKPLPASD
jgi:hypothetical protein